MRSVNATFAAALAAGTGKPVFRLNVDNGTYATYETKDIIAYKLTATTLTVVLNFWLEHDFTVISIERGLVVGSTEYTYESADFWVRKVITNNIHALPSGESQGITTITATILPNTPYTIATGNNEYWTFIEDIGVSNNLAYMIQGGTLGSGGDSWKDHKFFPVSGNNVTIPDRMQFIPMIRRKYAIAMVARDRDTSGNNDNGYLYAFRYKAAETATAYTLNTVMMNQDGSKTEAVRFVWRDEDNAAHTEGTSGLYINIGYHFSTEMSAPDTNRRPAGHMFVIRPNFAIENGDKVTLTAEGASITMWANIEESFDPKQSPAWQMKIMPIDFLEGLSGGVNPYAPSITTTPDGEDTENSSQSLFEYLLRARATAETQTANIYRPANSPGGTSAFAGTIATLPGGATLTYTPTSGTENAMVPQATTNLGKMMLHNTTRGTSALIENCVAGTNTITLTAAVPVGWATTDVITIVSQTVSGGSVPWVDIEITSGPLNKAAMFLNFQLVSATVGNTFYVHPFETYAASKTFFTSAQVANTTAVNMFLVKIVDNRISIGWTGAPTALLMQEAGFI